MQPSFKDICNISPFIDAGASSQKPPRLFFAKRMDPDCNGQTPTHMDLQNSFPVSIRGTDSTTMTTSRCEIYGDYISSDLPCSSDLVPACRKSNSKKLPIDSQLEVSPRLPRLGIAQICAAPVLFRMTSTRTTGTWLLLSRDWRIRPGPKKTHLPSITG